MEDHLLTMAEVAARVRAPLDTVRYWRAQGTGPQGFKVGRRVLFRESDVAAWLDAQMTAQRA
jgi:excisionase family DNA binding protein